MCLEKCCSEATAAAPLVSSEGAVSQTMVSEYKVARVTHSLEYLIKKHYLALADAKGLALADAKGLIKLISAEGPNTKFDQH